MPEIHFSAVFSDFQHTMGFSLRAGHGSTMSHRVSSVRQTVESSLNFMPQMFGCLGPLSSRAWSFGISSGDVCGSSKSARSIINHDIHPSWRAESSLKTFARDGSGESMSKSPSAKRRSFSRRQKDATSTVISSSMTMRSPTDDAATLWISSDTCSDDEHSDIHTVSTKLLRVAVDVDEVLGSFLSTLNAFIAEEHTLKYNVSQYHVYDFMKIWRCSQAEANDLVHAFFESDHFKDGIPPIPGAHESLLHLAEFCHLVIVTSRQHVIKNQTLDWIERHYPGIFHDVYFGNHFALEGEARPKSEICRSIGAEVLIDDNPRYAMECAHHGIEVLLFDHNNTYPWSKTEDGPVHPLITRVTNWKEVEFCLLGKAYDKRT